MKNIFLISTCLFLGFFFLSFGAHAQTRIINTVHTEAYTGEGSGSSHMHVKTIVNGEVVENIEENISEGNLHIHTTTELKNGEVKTQINATAENPNAVDTEDTEKSFEENAPKPAQNFGPALSSFFEKVFSRVIQYATALFTISFE